MKTFLYHFTLLVILYVAIFKYRVNAQNSDTTAREASSDSTPASSTPAPTTTAPTTAPSTTGASTTTTSTTNISTSVAPKTASSTPSPGTKLPGRCSKLIFGSCRPCQNDIQCPGQQRCCPVSNPRVLPIISFPWFLSLARVSTTKTEIKCCSAVEYIIDEEVVVVNTNELFM